MSTNEKVLLINNNPKFVGHKVTKGLERKVYNVMDNNFITKDDLKSSEEKNDLKIKVAVQPIEGKIDLLSEKIENLPTEFENLLLKERQHQDDKSKETRRYIVGTIGIGLLSIIVSVILNFI